MEDQKPNPAAVVERLVRATNDHDIEALVACFNEHYVNETPVHPPRGFKGAEQVRRNWTQIFGGVPDIKAQVLRDSVQGDIVWTEWEMAGTRHDGDQFLMRGVIIFQVRNDGVESARFYLEPVEEVTGDVTAAVERVAGSGTGAVPSASNS
jgi:ketosteroid isomerase-like protein